MASHDSGPAGGSAGEPLVVADRYRLHVPLGTGAMGTVWSAFDDFLHRWVAVKLVYLEHALPAETAERMRQRTLREARAVAGISHPNVITLHDVVTSGGEPCIVMELLPARNLAGLIADLGPLSVPQVATVADAVAAALEAAEAAGVTHRDVKPGNVLVCRDGRAKLTDFGIAAHATDAARDSGHLLLGSPAYMAPEVASGHGAGPEADLWGLGATVFAALSGHPPYDEADDAMATVRAVSHDPVPRLPDGPLSDIVTALMQKDPRLRPRPPEVRQALAAHRAAPGAQLFQESLFPHTGVGADGAPEGAGPPGAARGAGATPDSPQEEAAPEPAAPLATDPGPLPFRERDTASTGGPATSVALAVAAVLLFCLSALAGTAATRWTAGAEILPATALGGGAGDGSTGEYAYRYGSRTGNAGSTSGAGAAPFTVPVPQGWATFVSRHDFRELPASTRTEYVSGDGAAVITVERFPDYFVHYELDDYLDELHTEVHRGGIELGTREVVDPPEGTEASTAVCYRVPADGDHEAHVPRRTTTAHLARSGNEMWLVGVTVPTRDEDAGHRMLTERVAPGFTVLG
ncbi:Protein kinase domain-containing protein [Haloechinothrix alba]|uniref:non-specific serine/threonine protein kinase n=1 Tax=Haloechinothrix alba TaxID=664784 RepID=A0A238VVS9_9PSEU|nr:serine/threonine-protein kinase [Haloechinothrix alba]SNR38291.1 Protein kinase domain-containing protein [Haloechinothrix alba]